ncbi:hypothetical protein [Solimicrobium silvestre]|uniref:HEAT repeat domain-containing protein n=1 Tax=Solimicrobium silvestre TaxID=2099400 RepID=A0A2S9GSI6_9BURK|nr:hypothetical protein [Solimicrobium silvestre]PRC90656.1 hypothetical protein S2091_4639 [Solimicrobium silvestre]
MIIPQRGSNAFKLLYTGNNGEEIGLDEVQLLDDYPQTRIRDLSALLNDSNLFIRYQAILILTAWGLEVGIDNAENMIVAGVADDLNLSPNRINGKDNRFDDLAEAIHLYVLSGGSGVRACKAFCALLKSYPIYYFESKFKRALLKHATPEMIGEIKDSILKCLKAGKFYQASQLLPILAKLDSVACWDIFPEIAALPMQIPDPAANIAEALRYISTQDSDKLLTQYLTHKGAGVALAAQESIDFKKKQSIK